MKSVYPWPVYRKRHIVILRIYKIQKPDRFLTHVQMFLIFDDKQIF